MLTPSLVQEITQLHADFCSALADSTRLLLLYALAERPRTVSELADELRLPQPTISRHLKILRERSLVVATRQGMSVEYALADERIVDALDLLRSIMRDRIQYQARLVAQP
ncbi:MAG: metalloregulator ArsR/SmtB family transcription factor [Anaerolineales bacterium]|nr:metalloregulator ArsR/SmtB family transcription factor [Anaerolineales bacterium]MCX7608489.1 metalloregulator ArsR/SmtB family transcription factor [Anaerolineales bacterium]MDW8226921.1 metalloregulator ArsR/SmtB family transcription factor [Anaerolineales bacterium]